MNLIKTYIDEQEGNDCRIKESYALIESAGKKYVLRHTFVEGAFEDDTFTVLPFVEASESLPYRVIRQLTREI